MDWNAIIDMDKQLLLDWNGSSSLFLDGLVKTLTTATTWIPLYIALLYLVIKNNDSVKNVLLIAACAGLCVFLAGSLDDMIVKPLVGRWRPARDADIGMMVDVVNGYRGGRFGFFSAHASNTFSIAVFFCWLVRSRILSVGMVLWSLVNGWTRIYLGVHFPGDVLCGLLWGAVVGTGVYYLYYRISRSWTTNNGFISSKYTKTGYRLIDVDVVMAVMVFTLFYAVLRACYYIYI